MDKLESLNSKSKWGGARPGAGHPKGKKTEKVIKREAALRGFRQRVAEHTDELFNAQYDLAKGEKYLMVIQTIGTGSKQRRETSIVTDPQTIKQFLDEELPSTDTEYYFMSTKPANILAINSLMDRTYGKPDSKIELEHSGEIKDGNFDPKLAGEFAEYLKKSTKKA